LVAIVNCETIELERKVRSVKMARKMMHRGHTKAFPDMGLYLMDFLGGMIKFMIGEVSNAAAMVTDI